MHGGRDVRRKLMRHHLAALLGDFESAAEQALSRRRTQTDDDFRLQDGDLGFQP